MIQIIEAVMNICHLGNLILSLGHTLLGRLSLCQNKEQIRFVLSVDTSDLVKISIPIMVNKHRCKATSRITLGKKKTERWRVAFASVFMRTEHEYSVIA